MSYPGKRNFPHGGGYQFGVVVGQGSDKDKVVDQSELGLIQVKSLTDHGDDVKTDHLALVSTRGDLQSWQPRPPLPGSPVYIESQSGSNPIRIAQIARNTKNSPTTSVNGNQNLFTADKDAMEAWTRKLGFYPLPDLKETKERGAAIRKVVEKDKFSTSMLKGLPTNGSIFSLIEHKLPEKKNVETAKEHFNNILGSDILSKLPGSGMSLGGLFKKLTDKQKKSVTGSMPPDVAEAFESLSYLLPNVETDSDVTYQTDVKVDEATFIANAIELLSQIKSLTELNYVLSRLLTDSSLFGLDKLDDVEIEISTPFGNVQMRIDATGGLSLANSNTNNATAQARESFGGFMSSGSASGGAPSIEAGQNLFGDSSKTMLDMFQRAAPEALQKATELMKATNSSASATKRNQIMRVFAEGGNPIQTFFQNIDGGGATS